MSSVRQVEKTMYELKMYRTEQGEKTVMVGPPGRKLLPILMIDGSSGLTVKKVPLSDQRYLRDVREEKKRRSTSGVIRQFRGIGRRLGMTKAAKSFLADATKAV
jgi:hypothetical protein